MVALMRVSSSSSPRMASWRWRGVMRFTLRSLAAFCGGESATLILWADAPEGRCSGVDGEGRGEGGVDLRPRARGPRP